MSGGTVPMKTIVGTPNIGDPAAFQARVGAALERGYLSNGGPFCQEFESRLAEALGVGHCIAVCNATVGLEIAAVALEITGEVILPSFTFVATAHAMRWVGLTPVFCEIDPVTHNIDPARLPELITERTSAILGVHCWGRPCDTEAIGRIADDNGLKVFYDASHAIFCTHGGRPIGGFGELEVFSFHATKFLNTFEGGAITTNNAELAERLRCLRNFGLKTPEHSIGAGTNGKMSEVSAAMGLTNMEAAEGFFEANLRNHELYRSELSECEDVRVIGYPDAERNNRQYVIAEVRDRDRVWNRLRESGIGTRRYFHPGVHQMEPYAGSPVHVRVPLPETEALCSRVLALPTGIRVTGDQVREVCRSIREILAD